MKTRFAVLISGAVLASAASASVVSLALFDLAIGFVLLTGAAWAAAALSARGVSVERTISASEVQEDSPLRLHFAVRQRRWLPVHVEVEDHGGGWLPIGRGDVSIDVPFGRPGAYWLGPSWIRLRDAIGVFERRRLVGRTEPLMILPAPESSESLRLTDPGLIGDPEPQGLQPYAPGMPLARIHWPALAKGAGLQVRHYATPQDGLPLVVVDTVGAAHPGALDWTARVAAGYVSTLARNGGCLVLLPGDATPTSVVGSDGAWRAVHRRLATLADLPPRTTLVQAVRGGTLRVRAATAPAGMGPAPPLPRGVSTTTRCPSA
jgi:uncharacterized protein (DUF58 family)